MGPKKGKGKAGPVDGVDTTSMSREQLEAFSLRLKEELDREREERNFFQLERDKLRTFWEITRQQLEENRAQLRNQDRAQDENEEKHQSEIKVYKQKVKHLLYEHQCNLTELKAEGTVSLKMAQDEYTAMEQQLLKDKNELKSKLREQELAHHDAVRQLKMEHSAEVSQLREQFSRDTQELERKYETRLGTQSEEFGLQHAMEIGEVEQRKNRQIVELTKSHEQAFNDMKNYYNDITLNNLALISSLKEQMEELKSGHERMEKQLRDVQGENKRLNEPLKQARTELTNLQRQLASYEQDKITLANTKQRLALVTKELEDLRWENEVLELRFEKVEKERDRLHSQFVSAILEVQQKSGLKSAMLEKKTADLKSGKGGVSFKFPKGPPPPPPPRPPRPGSGPGPGLRPARRPPAWRHLDRSSRRPSRGSTPRRCRSASHRHSGADPQQAADEPRVTPSVPLPLPLAVDPSGGPGPGHGPIEELWSRQERAERVQRWVQEQEQELDVEARARGRAGAAAGRSSSDQSSCSCADGPGSDRGPRSKSCASIDHRPRCSFCVETSAPRCLHQVGEVGQVAPQLHGRAPTASRCMSHEETRPTQPRCTRRCRKCRRLSRRAGPDNGWMVARVRSPRASRDREVGSPSRPLLGQLPGTRSDTRPAIPPPEHVDDNEPDSASHPVAVRVHRGPLPATCSSDSSYRLDFSAGTADRTPTVLRPRRRPEKQGDRKPSVSTSKKEKGLLAVPGALGVKVSQALIALPTISSINRSNQQEEECVDEALDLPERDLDIFVASAVLANKWDEEEAQRTHGPRSFAVASSRTSLPSGPTVRKGTTSGYSRPDSHLPRASDDRSGTLSEPDRVIGVSRSKSVLQLSTSDVTVRAAESRAQSADRRTIGSDISRRETASVSASVAKTGSRAAAARSPVAPSKKPSPWAVSPGRGLMNSTPYPQQQQRRNPEPEPSQLSANGNSAVSASRTPGYGYGPAAHARPRPRLTGGTSATAGSTHDPACCGRPSSEFSVAGAGAGAGLPSVVLPRVETLPKSTVTFPGSVSSASKGASRAVPVIVPGAGSTIDLAHTDSAMISSCFASVQAAPAVEERATSTSVQTLHRNSELYMSVTDISVAALVKADAAGSDSDEDMNAGTCTTLCSPASCQCIHSSEAQTTVADARSNVTIVSKVAPKAIPSTIREEDATLADSGPIPVSPSPKSATTAARAVQDSNPSRSLSKARVPQKETPPPNVAPDPLVSIVSPSVPTRQTTTQGVVNPNEVVVSRTSSSIPSVSMTDFEVKVTPVSTRIFSPESDGVPHLSVALPTVTLTSASVMSTELASARALLDNAEPGSASSTSIVATVVSTTVVTATTTTATTSSAMTPPVDTTAGASSTSAVPAVRSSTVPSTGGDRPIGGAASTRSHDAYERENYPTEFGDNRAASFIERRSFHDDKPSKFGTAPSVATPAAGERPSRRETPARRDGVRPQPESRGSSTDRSSHSFESGRPSKASLQTRGTERRTTISPVRPTSVASDRRSVSPSTKDFEKRSSVSPVQDGSRRAKEYMRAPPPALTTSNRSLRKASWASSSSHEDLTGYQEPSPFRESSFREPDSVRSVKTTSYQETASFRQVLSKGPPSLQDTEPSRTSASLQADGSATDPSTIQETTSLKGPALSRDSASSRPSSHRDPTSFRESSFKEPRTFRESASFKEPPSFREPLSFRKSASFKEPPYRRSTLSRDPAAFREPLFNDRRSLREPPLSRDPVSFRESDSYINPPTYSEYGSSIANESLCGPPSFIPPSSMRTDPSQESRKPTPLQVSGSVRAPTSTTSRGLSSSDDQAAFGQQPSVQRPISVSESKSQREAASLRESVFSRAAASFQKSTSFREPDLPRRPSFQKSVSAKERISSRELSPPRAPPSLGRTSSNLTLTSVSVGATEFGAERSSAMQQHRTSNFVGMEMKDTKGADSKVTASVATSSTSLGCGGAERIILFPSKIMRGGGTRSDGESTRVEEDRKPEEPQRRSISVDQLSFGEGQNVQVQQESLWRPSGSPSRSTVVCTQSVGEDEPLPRISSSAVQTVQEDFSSPSSDSDRRRPKPRTSVQSVQTEAVSQLRCHESCEVFVPQINDEVQTEHRPVKDCGSDAIIDTASISLSSRNRKKSTSSVTSTGTSTAHSSSTLVPELYDPNSGERKSNAFSETRSLSMCSLASPAPPRVRASERTSQDCESTNSFAHSNQHTMEPSTRSSRRAGSPRHSVAVSTSTLSLSHSHTRRSVTPSKPRSSLIATSAVSTRSERAERASAVRFKDMAVQGNSTGAEPAGVAAASERSSRTHSPRVACAGGGYQDDEDSVDDSSTIGSSESTVDGASESRHRLTRSGSPVGPGAGPGLPRRRWMRPKDQDDSESGRSRLGVGVPTREHTREQSKSPPRSSPQPNARSSAPRPFFGQRPTGAQPQAQAKKGGGGFTDWLRGLRQSWRQGMQGPHKLSVQTSTTDLEESKRPKRAKLPVTPPPNKPRPDRGDLFTKDRHVFCYHRLRSASAGRAESRTSLSSEEFSVGSARSAARSEPSRAQRSHNRSKTQASFSTRAPFGVQCSGTSAKEQQPQSRRPTTVTTTTSTTQRHPSVHFVHEDSDEDSDEDTDVRSHRSHHSGLCHMATSTDSQWGSTLDSELEAEGDGEPSPARSLPQLPRRGGLKRSSRYEAEKRSRCRSEGRGPAATRTTSPSASGSLLDEAAFSARRPRSAFDRHIHCYESPEMFPPIPSRSSSKTKSSGARLVTQRLVKGSVAASKAARVAKAAGPGKREQKAKRKPQKKEEVTEDDSKPASTATATAPEPEREAFPVSCAVECESRTVIWTTPGASTQTSDIVDQGGPMWLRFPAIVNARRERTPRGTPGRSPSKEDPAPEKSRSSPDPGEGCSYTHRKSAQRKDSSSSSSTPQDDIPDSKDPASLPGTPEQQVESPSGAEEVVPEAETPVVTFPGAGSTGRSSSSHVFWKRPKNRVTIQEIFSDNVLFGEDEDSASVDSLSVRSDSPSVVTSRLSCLQEETDSAVNLDGAAAGASVGMSSSHATEYGAQSESSFDVTEPVVLTPSQEGVWKTVEDALSSGGKSQASAERPSRPGTPPATPPPATPPLPRTIVISKRSTRHLDMDRPLKRRTPKRAGEDDSFPALRGRTRLAMRRVPASQSTDDNPSCRAASDATTGTPTRAPPTTAPPASSQSVESRRPAEPMITSPPSVAEDPGKPPEATPTKSVASMSSRTPKVRFRDDGAAGAATGSGSGTSSPKSATHDELKLAVEAHFSRLRKNVVEGSDARSPVQSRSTTSVKPKPSTPKFWTASSSSVGDQREGRAAVSAAPTRILVSRARSTASLTGIHDRPASPPPARSDSLQRVLRGRTPGRELMVVELFAKRRGASADAKSSRSNSSSASE